MRNAAACEKRNGSGAERIGAEQEPLDERVGRFRNRGEERRGDDAPCAVVNDELPVCWTAGGVERAGMNSSSVNPAAVSR